MTTRPDLHARRAMQAHGSSAPAERLTIGEKDARIISMFVEGTGPECVHRYVRLVRDMKNDYAVCCGCGLAYVWRDDAQRWELASGAVQDKAVELGLLKPTPVTEPCAPDGACACEEFGFPTTCLRRTKP